MSTEIPKINLNSVATFLDKMAENSENVYWLSSPDLQRIEYISPAYEKIWGRSVAELYRNPELWISYLHPEDVKNHHPIHEMAIKIKKDGEKARYHENYRIIRPDGEIRWIIDRGFPIYGDNGECCGITGVAIDVTAEKLAEEQLRLAKEKAEEANELKTKFIQNMQHDIRTPLAGLYGYMKQLAEEETNVEKKQFAKYMSAAAGQLLNMCNELVDFENIDYLGETTKLEPVEILRFLSKVIDLNKVAAHHRGLKLRLSIDSAVPPQLKLDKKKLYRVLVNLIGNSLKFTDEGAVTLNAKLVSTAHNIATISFEIHDTGIGIPANKITHIFDKFVRLNPSNQAKYKGSGLGLYYVKKFVEDMGGKLEVESIEGKGSTFRVILSLPIPQPDEKEEKIPHEIDTFDQEIILHEIDKFPDAKFNKQQKNTVKHAGTNTRNKMDKKIETKLQILLIEDDIILQRTIGQTFKNKDCDVVATVDSVSKACEAIKARSYDLVVCDLGIHEGTGIDVINWVKHDKNHPNQKTPFVVLTANNDESVKQEALASGFLDVLQKPLEPEVAQNIIDTYTYIKSTSTELHTENKIIDIDASLNISNDLNLVKKIYGMLSKSLLKDKKALQMLYDKNDIEKTRSLLLRLNGVFCYCVVPRLQEARGKLDKAVKKAKWLTTVTPLYDAFYKEIDNFLSEYEQLKSEGKL